MATVADEFVRANQKYASTFTKGELPLPPARKVAVVVCMDARIDPARALGLEEGDAHVIRNAGGRISDALRSLTISQTLLGSEEVVIIHHTDCGMLTFSDGQIRTKLRSERGVDADAVAFLPFTDLDASVRDDLAAYEASPLVRHDVPLRGFVYQVESGALREVARAPNRHHKGAEARQGAKA
jgi:carbonic anhydrase